MQCSLVTWGGSASLMLLLGRGASLFSTTSDYKGTAIHTKIIFVSHQGHCDQSALEQIAHLIPVISCTAAAQANYPHSHLGWLESEMNPQCQEIDNQSIIGRFLWVRWLVGGSLMPDKSVGPVFRSRDRGRRKLGHTDHDVCVSIAKR